MKIQNVSETVLHVRETALRFDANVKPGKFLPDSAPKKVKDDIKASIDAAKRKGYVPNWKITGEKIASKTATSAVKE